jgi:hypothetical protein
LPIDIGKALNRAIGSSNIIVGVVMIVLGYEGGGIFAKVLAR